MILYPLLLREKGRGRDPKLSKKHIEWLNSVWTEPGDLSDYAGKVEMFRYNNNNEDDKVQILKGLGNYLGMYLL